MSLSLQVDVRKGGDNISLKRRKVSFSERDEMCSLCLISIQTETQISLCSSYVWICNLFLTKKRQMQTGYLEPQLSQLERSLIFY